MKKRQKKDPLLEFLQQPLKNNWLHYPNMSVYVRKGRHLKPGTRDLLNCLDIGSVTVHHTGKGTFSAWLEQATDLASKQGLQAVYIENVLTDRFADFFREKGWIEHNNGLPSFFLDLTPSIKHEATESAFGMS